jgi:HTH-type transcriptional regulator/antitoxin HigA
MSTELKPIRTTADYERALAAFERLWGAESGTAEGDRLDVLATLIDAYESEHDPIDPPDPIEAIKFRMEQQGLKRRDLEAWIGTRTRVAEVLNGKRGLSIGMIRRLHEGLGIAAEILIRPPRNLGRTPGAGRPRAAAAAGRTKAVRRTVQAGARESKGHLGESAGRAGGAARGRRSSGPSSRGGQVREDREG